MENFSFVQLAKEITDLQEEGLSFEDKQLTWDTAEDVKEIVTALENTQVVHYLKLEGNTLGVPAAAAIGKALEKHSEFRKALWRNMFTRRLKTEIPKSLEHLGNGLQIAQAQLVVLDLSDNALGPNGMVGLENLLSSRVCYSLQELRLNNCGLGIGGGKMLSDALLKCHKSSTEAGTPLKLKVFVTGRNRLENAGAKSIAKIFATIQTLEEITMPQNSIYHEGVKALAIGFSMCSQLQTLNLNDNTVTYIGAQYIAEALAMTPHLRELNLGDCLLKTDGAYVLSEALQEGHQQLEVVDLGHNEIGPDGGLALAQALQNKPRLKKLDLNGNEFGHEGRERLLEIAKSFPNGSVLQELDEDESENGSDDEDENGHDENTEEEDDVDDEEDVDGEEDEDGSSTDHKNESTEEADEYDDYNAGEEEDDEAPFITTDEFAKTDLNFSLNSNDNTIFADTTQTMTPIANAAAGTSVVCTAQTFCLSQSPCTLQQFEALPGDNKLQILQDYINLYTDDNYLLLLIFTAMKCAHLSQKSSDALHVATNLFHNLLEHAQKTKQERRITNYLLKQLGLLRSEEKFKSSYDKTSCQFALKKSLENYKLPSEYMATVLEVFLDQSTNTNESSA